MLQIAFKQHPEGNAVIELNNLLAHGDVLSVTKHQIYDIEERYGLRVTEQFTLNMEEFYAVYLNFCLKDSELNDAEKERLAHLQQLLSLTSQQIQKIHNNLGQEVYRKQVQKSVSNGLIANSEKVVLERLENDLNLPPDLVGGIAARVKEDYLKGYVDGMIAKQSISPDDEKQLDTVVQNLGIKPELSQHQRKLFLLIRQFWALENLALPVFDYKEILQKGEVCYMRIPAVRMYDTPASQRQYGRDLNTAKGIYIKIESGLSNAYTSRKTYVATGDLYLTDKRIFFDGPDKNSYVKFEKIMSISAFSGGVRINKESGKIPYFEFIDQLPQFCVVLERILREHN